MALMEQTNAKKRLWQVRDRTGIVVARGLSVHEAGRIMNDVQSREDAARYAQAKQGATQ